MCDSSPSDHKRAITYDAFFDREHQMSLSQALFRAQQSGSYTDLVLVCGRREFACHRLVLTAACPYFAKVLEGQLDLQVNIIEVKDIPQATLEKIIEYSYTSVVAITSEHAVDLLRAAQSLGLDSLYDACVNYMIDHMSVSNCLQYYRLAKGDGIAILNDKAFSFILENFAALSKDRSFLDLDQGTLIQLLKQDCLGAANEDVVLHSALTWLQHGQIARMDSAPELLKYVRLSFCSQAAFHATFEQSAFTRSRKARNLSQEYKRYHMYPEQRYQMFGNNRMVPRTLWGLRDTLLLLGGITIDGECNKEMYSFDKQHFSWTHEKLQPPFEDAQIQRISLSHIDSGFVVMINHCTDIPESHIWTYDVGTGLWHDISFNKRYKAYAALVTCIGRVYVLGGVRVTACPQDGSRVEMTLQTQVLELSLSRQAWRLAGQLPVALFSHTAVAYRSEILVFGGKKEVGDAAGSPYSRDTFRYDPVMNTWKTGCTMPSPCATGSAVVVKEKVYLVGALRRARQDIQGVALCYDPNTDTWATLPPMKPTQHMAALTCIDNHLVVVGGTDGHTEEPSTSISVYHPDIGVWQSEEGILPPLPQPVYGHVIAFVTLPVPSKRSVRGSVSTRSGGGSDISTQNSSQIEPQCNKADDNGSPQNKDLNHDEQEDPGQVEGGNCWICSNWFMNTQT